VLDLAFGTIGMAGIAVLLVGFGYEAWRSELAHRAMERHRNSFLADERRFSDGGAARSR
jgi:hypothetical protein